MSKPRRDGLAAPAAEDVRMVPLAAHAHDSVMNPHMKPRACRALHAVVTAWIVLMAFTCGPGGTARAGTALQLSRREVEGEQVLVVHSPFYRVALRPEAGAVVSSLCFGQGERTELTAWAPRTKSGLFQEMHTADLSFRLVEEDVGTDEIHLVFEGRTKRLCVRKAFRFWRGCPWFKLTLLFENRSELPLGFADGPGLCALALPAGGQASGREYYCLDRGRGPEAITPATVLRELGPLGGGGEPLAWLAVTDPVSRIGLGVVFLDKAALDPVAERNRNGQIVLSWRYRGVPARSALRTEMLVVPLEGFAAVSGLTPAFVGDTTASRAENGTPSVSLKLMPLGEGMSDVSVVTRAYAQDGSELRPCDTLVFEHIKPSSAAVGTLAVPHQPQPAWLQHEVYAGGERVGQFFASLAPGVRPRVSFESGLPPAEVVPLGGDNPDAADVGAAASPEAQRRGFMFWRFDGTAARQPVAPLHVALTSGERETLFFGIRSLRPIARLEASVGAGPQDAAIGVQPIHPAAAYLWSVEQDSRGGAYLAPLVERELPAHATVWIALTLDATVLASGRYSARLFVRAEGEPVGVPLIVSVSPLRLDTHEGFALWTVGGRADGGFAGPSALARLAGYSVDALSLPAPAETTRGSLVAFLRRARTEGMHMVGFHAPGGGEYPAERLLGPTGRRTSMPSEPLLTWLLSSGVDSGQDVARLRELGFECAVVAPRLAEIEKSPYWRGAAPRHWFVEEGCAPGVVRRLLREGVIRPDQCVWLYLDLRGMDWRRAAVVLRSAFWGGAWQGLAGAAVRSDLPLAQADRQSVLWHVLRDAREEAALAALAMQAGKAVLGAHGKPSERKPTRAAALARLTLLMGEGGAHAVAIEQEPRAYRHIVRAIPGEDATSGPLATFAAAKASAVEILEDLREPASDERRRANLYWRGVPLTDRGRILWLIVAGGGGDSHKVARELQQEIRRLTGRRVAVEREFPRTQDAAPEDLPRLIWLVWGGGSPDTLPPDLQEIGAVDREGPLLVRMRAGPLVAVLSPQADAKALARTLQPTPTPYRRAPGVR